MIPESELPGAGNPLLQHVIETYASETNKTASVFRQFDGTDLAFRPHQRSSTTEEIFRHQLLSERRFFAEFLGSTEPPPGEVIPTERTAEAFAMRLEALARPRLEYLAGQSDGWWTGTHSFFDVERQRIWIFWRRVLHSAHHRTQLTVYLRLLDKPVVSVYGPTADVTWKGADPTVR
ncbi:MAG TPA: DinB family protein [Bryobacteraceae bacterium]|nr:DinB family protein [Bryobacteraceae bacterium]